MMKERLQRHYGLSDELLKPLSAHSGRGFAPTPTMMVPWLVPFMVSCSFSCMNCIWRAAFYLVRTWNSNSEHGARPRHLQVRAGGSRPDKE